MVQIHWQSHEDYPAIILAQTQYIILAIYKALRTFKSSGMVQVEGLLVALIISCTSRTADSTKANATLKSCVYPITSVRPWYSHEIRKTQSY